MGYLLYLERNWEKYGADGIDVTQNINMGNVNDPYNFQIKISGSQIYNQLNSKLNSSEIQNYYTKLDITNLLNTKQNTITNNSLSISHINLLQDSLNSKLNSSEISNYFTKSEINGKGTNYIYEYNAGLYKVLNLKHNFGINFAISSNQNPTSSEILLSLESGSGVTINANAHIENNLTVAGNLIVGTTNILSAIENANLINYYNKTESDTRY